MEWTVANETVQGYVVEAKEGKCLAPNSELKWNISDLPRCEYQDI
jgi:hypothetical protein